MASTGSSDVENEDANNDQPKSPKKVGRAAEYPEFAIIWSYLENFYELLRFPELTLDGLEDAFNSHSPRNENCMQLEYLHKKLLVKLNRKFRPDKWEKALLKIAKEQNMLVSWDLENFGYDQLKIVTKLELFKMLLECQFDTNNKLKTVINKSYEADVLRLQPFGHDMDGLLYWFHMDEAGGVRLYSTEEDEVENESWKLLASDLDELENVVDFLIIKSQINPKDEVLAKKEEERKKKEENEKATKKGKKSKKASKVEEEDDNPCARCYSNVQPDSILLCDKCDGAYHTACLRPPLLNVPQGDWFCPFCQQLVLLERLKEKRTRLLARQRLRARQAKRLTKSGMNLSNILQEPGSEESQMDAIRRSGRSRKTVDYTFKEFDDEIFDAVEIDKKRLKLDDTNMNGHPTGKPAFSVQRFYASSSSTPRRRSRRLKDLDSGSESDSKTSDYEYDGTTDDDRWKRPERHVYLRRHIIEDDDDDDDDDESLKAKSNEKCESDNEGTDTMESKDDEGNDKTTRSDENDSKENIDKLTSQNDSTESNVDVSSEASGPTVEPTGHSTKCSTDSIENPNSFTEPTKSSDDKNKVLTKSVSQGNEEIPADGHDKKPASVDISRSIKPPPLERISPKVDPLGLDSLGFGALASCFSNNDRQSSSRSEHYSNLHSPQNIRSPLKPDAGYPSPSSYQRVSAETRFGNLPPSYDQSSSFTNYLAYNQTNLPATRSSLDAYQGTPSSRPSYPGINYPGGRQYPGFSPTNRDSSQSFSQPPSFSSSISNYPPQYPSSDMTSRSSYYQTASQNYTLPTKTPFSQGFFPDNPFSTGLFYGNADSTGMQQGGTSSWPSQTSNSASSYYSSSGVGKNKTGI